MRTKITSRGKMAFVQIDDGTTLLEVSVFNEVFEAERAKIRDDEVLIIEGKGAARRLCRRRQGAG